MSNKRFRIKRIYDDPSEDDGYRVLADRLWPRGISREDAHLDEWLKEISPSPELRKWFDHDPDRFEEFKKRYKSELAGKGGLIHDLRNQGEDQTVTLLYAARDKIHNHAIVLKDFLENYSG